ncbi:MAG: citrate/2-methylcitrate synthase [Pirellulales bacterium]
MTEQNYHPGLEGVVAGETAVSTIAGGLSYRGYSIEDLAEHADFEQCAYLVLYGELPKPNELDAFRTRVAKGSQVPSQIIEFLRQVPREASAMDVLRSGASLLAHWDTDQGDDSHEANLRKAERLTGQLPVVMAARHRLREGKEPVAPDATLSRAADTLHMLFRNRPTSEAVRALDVSLILYMEHEYNASAFAARVICSTLSDLHSSVTGAIGALKGPLHGGANERVMETLQGIESPQAAEKWVREALAAKRRIMGFGHRVYKEGDPRAAYLKPLCAALAEQTGNQGMEESADVIERIVREEKGLPPNLDWPSARLYYYLGLPIDLYTPLFVLARVVGWSAHVIEQLDNNRLIRPRSRYTGPEPRSWVPIEERSKAAT